jgi:predicted lipoprotein with Yx(FWY)xxD motif
MRTRIPLFAVAGVLTLGLAACGSSYGDGDDAADKRERDSSEQVQEPQAPAPQVPEGIATGQTSLGEVLVDAQGRTLYGFTKDTSGTSTCFDACAATWPAVPGDTAIDSALDQALFQSVDRPDGDSQLVAGTWPAYTFSGDTGAGEANGQGSGGVWFALAPNGSLIK